MVLLDTSHEPRHRYAVLVVTFPSLDWIEEMERTRRGQEKRQLEKQARLAAKQHYKNKRQQVKNNAAARAATITTVAAASSALSSSEKVIAFQNFLEFLSSSPGNTTTNNTNDNNNRQAILDLPLCSTTLSSFDSHSSIPLAAAMTREEKINLIHKLKSNMMYTTAPLDIVVYYSGLVWMTQARSNGLYDFSTDKAGILQGSDSDSDGNDDKSIIRPHYEDDDGGAVETQNDENSVNGNTLIEAITSGEENIVIAKQGYQQFTDHNENDKDNSTVVPNVMDGKNNTHQSALHENENWLVCCPQSYFV